MFRLVLYSDCAPSGIGGTEWSVRRLAVLLREQGVDVTVINRLEMGEEYRFTLRYSTVDQIPWITCMPSLYHAHAFDNRRYMEEMFRAIYTHIRQKRVCLVHIFGTGPGCFAAGTAAAAAGVPFVLSLRGSDLMRDTYDARRHSQIEWLMEQSSARVFVSMELMSFATAVYKRMPMDQNKVVYNSTDKRWFIPSDVSGIEKELRGAVIGCVGPIREQMGFAWTIEALSLLLTRQRDVTLLVIGGQHERERELVDSLLSNNRYPERVVITGPVHHESIISFMKLCDVGLLLPRTEGCPNKLLEFMLAGVPAVARPIGAIPEIIRDQVSGLLVDPDDSLSVVNALEYLLGDDEARSQMSKEGKAIVESKFCSETEIKGVMSVYHDVSLSRNDRQSISGATK